MLRAVLSALLTLATCASPAIARADTIDHFSLTGNGLVLDFSLPASPTPGYRQDGELFSVSNIDFVYNGLGLTAPEVLFYDISGGGGFSFQDADFNNVLLGINFFGPQLYTGSVDQPTFLTGTFELTPTQCTDPAAPCGPLYELNITTVTPEPASILLLGAGALGSIAAVRRRLAE